MSELADAAEKFAKKQADAPGDSATAQNQHLRAQGDGQTRSDQLQQARALHAGDAAPKSPEDQAKQTVDQLKHGPQDAQHIIEAVNKIQPESQRQLVLQGIKYAALEDDKNFPNVRVSADTRESPYHIEKFDGKANAQQWSDVQHEIGVAGQKRVAREQQELQHMREHPEEAAHKIEELAHKGLGQQGDQKAESDLRHQIEDLKKLPPDIQEKILNQVVKDEGGHAVITRDEIVFNPGTKNEDHISRTQSYQEQSEAAKQKYIASMTHVAEGGGSTSWGASQAELEAEAQKNGTAGRVEGDQKKWFNHD